MALCTLYIVYRKYIVCAQNRSYRQLRDCINATNFLVCISTPMRPKARGLAKHSGPSGLPNKAARPAWLAGGEHPSSRGGHRHLKIGWMLNIDLISSNIRDPPPPDVCIQSVGICVTRRGRKRFIASWGKDVTYLSLYPMPPPPQGIGQRSKVAILPTSAQQGVILYLIDGPCCLPWQTTPHALFWGWSTVYCITKCTQNTVMRYVTQGRHVW